MRTLAAAVMCAGAFAAACSSGSNDVAPVSFQTVPVATTPPGTEPLSTPGTTQPVAPTGQPVAEPETTPPATTLDPVTTTDGVTGPTFSDALGVKVDTAPGVHTVGDTRQLLPEGLYVHIAWQRDPNDLSVFTPREEDIEILEAYANAMRVFYAAAITTVTIDPSTFGNYMIDEGAQYAANFEEARAGGYVGSLGGGVVLRPYLLHDKTTSDSAVLLDCYLQDEQYIPRGSSVEPQPLQPKGTIATMARTDTGWKVDVIASEPQACL